MNDIEKFDSAFKSSNPDASESLLAEARELHFGEALPSARAIGQKWSEGRGGSMRNIVNLKNGFGNILSVPQDDDFAASIYRDLVVISQGIAETKLCTDQVGAKIMIDGIPGTRKDPTNSASLVEKMIERDPYQKDAETLTFNQKTLEYLVDHGRCGQNF